MNGAPNASNMKQVKLLKRRSVVIIGALGMDFHTFNTVFRNDESYEVLAFTIASEQNIGTTDDKAERVYPKELAGPLYPHGIPMIPESQLESFVKANNVDEVVFAYSDVNHSEVMHKASRALANGADYRLISKRRTQIKSTKPILAVLAVRTGCGKSQVSQYAVGFLKKRGLKVVAIREPMPYGDLVKQEVMRFASLDDFKKYDSTTEEQEEYEPYVANGLVIYSGVDYEKIVREAEKEADVIIFDGGNNEQSFYVADTMLCIVDPLRPGHELEYHPGEVNARAADVFIINKMNSAKNEEDVKVVEKNLTRVNPSAKVIKTNSIVSVPDPSAVKGKTAIVVEDGPTVTHGGMAWGAGIKAAEEFGVKVIDPRPFAKGGLAKAFVEFPHMQKIVPAMGYTADQLKDLEATLNAAKCDIILNGSPADLSRVLNVNKPIVRVKYDVAPYGGDDLADIMEEFVSAHCSS